MIQRLDHLARLRALLAGYPVAAILGARQVGKTTLADQLKASWQTPVHQFDLERQSDLARLADAELALEPLKGLVVLDEIQRMPGLFALLRVLADRRPLPARFLVLGSAAPELLRQGNETLAGRLTTHVLNGLSLREVGFSNQNRRWLRGGFPRAYLAASDGASWDWREDFIDTFLERDLPQLGIRVGASTMRRFFTMLAHYHGQVWNAAQFARNFGVSNASVRRYLDILTSALVVRQLQPWHENLKKRQVKSPKIYLSDSGMLHALLGITEFRELEAHPKLGASWEGFAMSQVIERLGVRPHECYFWATHTGAELDLLVTRGMKRQGFEFKRTSAPAITKSMRIAAEDLGLSRFFVVHAGRHSYDLSGKIRAVALSDLMTEITPWSPATQ